MELKNAAEIMIPLERFPFIPCWFTLRQAMAELDRANVETPAGKCVPWVILVFSAQNHLLGIVQRLDILRGLRPQVIPHQPANHAQNLFDVKTDPNLFNMTVLPEKAIQQLRSQIERPVQDFMMPIKAYVDAGDSILQVIHQMIEQNLSFIPVLSERRVVGIIYVLDVLHSITDLVV